MKKPNLKEIKTIQEYWNLLIKYLEDMFESQRIKLVCGIGYNKQYNEPLMTGALRVECSFNHIKDRERSKILRTFRNNPERFYTMIFVDSTKSQKSEEKVFEQGYESNLMPYVELFIIGIC